jgi:hypothetical protein
LQAPLGIIPKTFGDAMSSSLKKMLGLKEGGDTSRLKDMLGLAPKMAKGGAVHMQDGGRLPPGIKRATERAKQSKSVLPVAGARQARQAIQGYLGMDPSFSVMDPEAQALESAYRGGETASVLGDLFASLTPFAVASAASKANQVPGLAELIAYHGSPHKFKKFDASKIGTGEGAQAYGHGLYFAENPKVAKEYAINLANRDLANQGRLNAHANAKRLATLAGDPKYAADDIRSVLELNPEHEQAGLLKATLEMLESGDYAKPLKTQGSLYTVDIPDEKIAQMLDWDKPLSQQPWQMKRISPLLEDSGISADLIPKLTGKDIMAVDGPMASWFGVNRTPKMFAEGLRQEGIPGIKYLDQASRDAKKGTRNFVVFPGEEQNIKMLDINGEPQMAAGGAVNMQDGGSPLDQFYQPVNPMARRAAEQERMRQEIARRRAEELARQQAASQPTALDTSLPGPPPQRPGLPSMADLKGAFERRVQPFLNEIAQTAATFGTPGDVLRAYGDYSIPVNQAMMTALGRPFQQEKPPEMPTEMTEATSFRRMGDPYQRFAGQILGDPLTLVDPGILRGLEAGARAVTPSIMRGLEVGKQAAMPLTKSAVEKLTDMAMQGLPGTEVMQLRMGILPETPKLPSLTDEALPAPKIEGEAPTGGMSIRPEQLELPVSQVVKRGEEVPPMTTPPTPEQVAAARADTRMSADIVADRLNVIVPEAERVLGGIYKPGRPDGGKWSDLTPEELSKNLPGFPGTDADLNRMWDETLSEVSQAARDAVARTGATWQGFPAADFDVAMRLPLRNQLWYELSGEAFVDRVPDASLRESLILLDLVGATSARARPEENLERALAILSQRLRGVPVDVDITIPSTVTQALNRSGTNISSDLANKTGMFSDTIALTGGIPVRYPISVNDVWEGRTYGITDEALSKNQPLHEVFAKYQNKVRDFVNENGDFPYPVQSWNVQALKWVKKRFDDLGIDPLGPASLQGSDYAAEFDKIVNKLERAGIKVPNGQITRNVLLNPKTADALRPTTPGFRRAPKATVEFGTLLTPAGQRAAQIYEAAKNTGDELTQQEYRNILLSAMRDSSRGKPTPWESLARVASDEALSVTRIAAPTQDDPFSISGTFMGAAGPNIRIPLKELTPDQIAYFNSVAGLGLKQKAMAAAEILRLDPDMSLPQGFVPTHSIRFDFSGRVPETMLTDFAKALGEGFEISAMRYPDGMVFDINPRFGDAGPEAANVQSIDSAIDMLQQKYAIQNPKVFDAAYRSEYGKNYVEDPGNGSEYNRIIKDTLKGWSNEAAEKIAQLAGRSVNAKNINAFLAGKLESLPIDSAKLPSTVSLSSIQGRAKTIRKGLRQRLSDHDAALKAFNDIGLAVDSRMAAAIPKWDKRAAAMAKREQTKQGPEPEMAKGGRVHVSKNLSTIKYELAMGKKGKRYG